MERSLLVEDNKKIWQQDINWGYQQYTLRRANIKHQGWIWFDNTQSMGNGQWTMGNGQWEGSFIPSIPYSVAYCHHIDHMYKLWYCDCQARWQWEHSLQTPDNKTQMRWLPCKPVKHNHYLKPTGQDGCVWFHSRHTMKNFVVLSCHLHSTLSLDTVDLMGCERNLPQTDRQTDRNHDKWEVGRLWLYPTTCFEVCSNLSCNHNHNCNYNCRQGRRKRKKQPTKQYQWLELSHSSHHNRFTCGHNAQTTLIILQSSLVI